MSILDVYTQAKSDEDSVALESFAVLPQKLPIKKLGKEYKKIAGYVKMTAFSRLSDVILFDNLHGNEDASLLISINFTDLGFNRIVVESDINQSVNTRCQRCMQVMSYDIVAKINSVLVKNFADIIGKFSNYEQIAVESNELVDLYQLLEDEIILSLPIVIKHDDTNEECRKFSDFSI